MWCMLFAVIMRCEQSSVSDQEDGFRQLMRMTDNSRKDAMKVKNSLESEDDDDTSVGGMANNGKELIRNIINDTSEADSMQFEVDGSTKPQKARRKRLADSGDSGVSIYNSSDRGPSRISDSRNKKKHGSRDASKQANTLKNRLGRKRHQDLNEEVESDLEDSNVARRSGKSRPRGSQKYPRPSSLDPESIEERLNKYGKAKHKNRTHKGIESIENSGARESDEESSSRFINKLKGQARRKKARLG